MSAHSKKRPWLAVVLALYPGLGHVYLREWLRALLWFGLSVTSSTLLIPEGAVPSELSLESLLTASQSIPLDAELALLSITAFSMIDAYWMAKRNNEAERVDEGTTCPNCGKELDEDIDFCHWCTEPLAPDVDDGGD